MVEHLPSTDLEFYIIILGALAFCQIIDEWLQKYFCAAALSESFSLPFVFLPQLLFNLDPYSPIEGSPSPSRVPIARLYGIGRFRVPSEKWSRQRSMVAGKRLQE